MKRCAVFRRFGSLRRIPRPTVRGIVVAAALLLAAWRALGQASAPPGTVGDSVGEAGRFRGIRLGMTVEEVKAQLAREPLFEYRGDRDVSLLPSSGQLLIEVPGRLFVERGSFQFHEGRLLIMIVALSRELVSYFELYTELVSRYGAASALDPSRARWEVGGTRIALEKPVVLKYLDVATFEKLLASGRAGRDWELETRKRFLETF